jgi:hypothetical protein
MASILPPEREVRQAALIESGRPQKRYEISRLAQEIFFAGSASAFAMSLGPPLPRHGWSSFLIGDPTTKAAGAASRIDAR